MAEQISGHAAQVAPASANEDKQAQFAALELSLRERERQLHEAQRIARIGTWHWDCATDVVTWSEEVYLAFGLDPGQPAPGYESIRGLHAAGSRGLLETAVQRALADGTPYEHDIELLMPDGSPRWIIARGEVDFYREGKVGALRGTIQDITQRKLSELRLLEREREFREAQRIGRMGSWRWVLATNQVTWSEEVYSLMEHDRSLPVVNFSQHPEMFEGDSLQQLQSASARSVVDGSSYSVDTRMRLPSGTRLCLATQGEAILGANGEVVELRGTVRDITDRKLVEEELQRSENRYRSLIRATSEIVWISSSEGIQLNSIPEWQAFTGQTTAEVYGYGWADAIHPDDRPGAMEAWQQSLSSGTNLFIRHRLRRGDGVYRFMEARAVPSRDAEGRIVEWVGMHTDITEQVEAEQARRISEEMYRTVGESLDYGVWACDASGRNTFASDSFLRLVGMTQQQCSEFGWVESLHPNDRETTIARWKQCVDTGGEWDIEHRFRGVDGCWHPVLARGKAVHNDAGEVTGWAGINLDLTRLKEVETAIREREQRFSALAEGIPQLVWMSDPAGDKVYVNRRFLEYTGIPADAVAGPMWDRLVHPDDLPVFTELRRQSILNEEPFLAEFRICRHDNVYRTFLARALPVRDSAGKVERWLGSATDVHDQKLAENALRRSEKLAATGRLAASIAHEINNPLEAVTNSLYLALQDAALSSDTRVYLKMAEQELARVAHVTTQTLRFHRQSVAAALVDIADVMDSAYALFAPRFASCEIAVRREYVAGQMLFCRGDEVRQVFANFLSNALDATRRGGMVRIRIRRGCSWMGRARPGLRVTIGDTGHGIPTALQKTIFEPFISTKDTTGTGLGLWVSDGIVQQHKGHISLRSRPGETHSGTVFSLFFPSDGIQPGVQKPDTTA